MEIIFQILISIRKSIFLEILKHFEKIIWKDTDGLKGFF